MITRPRRRSAVAIHWMAWTIAALWAPLAYAHVGVGEASGFMHGLAHPITGLDHIIAMVAVGVWAAQRGGRATWIVPVTFVTVMSVGGALGTLGISMPFVEPGIVASVFVLGILIATAIRLPLVVSSLIVGLFAIFHGHAHGAEMPETALMVGYSAGFILATGLLHGIGIGLGLLARQLSGPLAIRYLGGAITMIGLYLCVA